MAMSNVKLAVAVTTAVVVLLVLTADLLSFNSYTNVFTSVERQQMYDSQNSTLGFQKILVLNMPSRKDRLRSMQALARYHQLDFTYTQTFDRYLADQLAKENNYLINGTHLACYLSHLHAYKTIIEENWNTALILEDDVDMEVDLKERHKWIMRQVQLEYKQDWDMLYLGHCTWDRREQDVVLSDRGMPGLYEAEYPMCLHAYAVSRECARRLVVVLEERLKTLGQDIDLVLAIGVEFGMSTVLGTTPPYIVQVGRRELASDLTELRDGDTGQRLQNSTLYGLHLRSIDPRTFPAYMA